MIQITLDINDRYSLGEKAQMAIEAGCQWIILPRQAASEGYRDQITDIATMCREAGVMLTIDDDFAAARDHGLHGVFIHLGGNPVEARSELGPEAVVGAEVASASTAAALAAADIDYMALPLDGKLSIIAETAATGAETFFVALCSAREADERFTDIMSAGFSGICVSSGAFDSANPVAFITNLLKRQ